MDLPFPFRFYDAMIILRDLSYVRLGTPDLTAAEKFVTDIVGLQAVDSEGDQLYLRSDNRHHTLCYFKGAVGDHALGIEIKDPQALDDAATELEAAGVSCHRGTAPECAERKVVDFIRFNDPSGNCIELVARPFEANRRYYGARDAGIQGLGHVGLNSTDPPRDEAFWLRHFNIRVSDWIGQVPLLRMTDIHHQIALFPTDKPGIQHVNHQVAEVDDVMRSMYFLEERQIKIVFGPGRHATSGGYFLYFEGHDGMVFEYSNSDRMIIDDDEAYRPRQFEMEHASFCVWGSKPDIPEFQ